jgi:hypothetical protein
LNTKTKQTLKNYFFIVILFIFTLQSCTEPKDVGMDVQPQQDLLNILYTDTTTVIAFTVAEDSVITDEILYNLLGNYNDPVFGNVSASFYTQIRLSENNINFGSNPVCDSIVLSLVYKGFYGDSISQVTVKVHELLNSIYLDSTYHSKRITPYSATNIAQNIAYVHNLKDSVLINGVKYPPQLRVKLNNSFGTQLLNAGAANLENNTAFTQFIKGLYITTDNILTNGGISYFDLVSSFSQLTLYYHNDDKDSLKFNFVIDQYCARYSTFDHYNFQNAVAPLKQQIAGNYSTADSILFVQAMGGTKVLVKFPYIKEFIKLNHIAINEAVLVMPVDNYDLSIGAYPPPPKMLAVRETTSGTVLFLPDYYEGESFYGGVYDSSKKEYRFRITKYLQGLINGNYIEDKGLNILVSGSSIRSNRVVLKGPGRKSNKTRLIITYTKIQ